MVKEMLTPLKNSHGLGPAVGGEGEGLTFSHGGSNAGFQCQLMAFTKLGQGVAIMTNGDRGRDLMMEILRSFSGIYDWNMYHPVFKSLVVLEESELQRFAGSYLLPWEGGELHLVLSVEDHHLLGKQVWNNFTFRIHAESSTRFFNREDAVEFQFVKNEDGSVSEVIVYEGGQEYHFARKNNFPLKKKIH